MTRFMDCSWFEGSSDGHQLLRGHVNVPEIKASCTLAAWLSDYWRHLLTVIRLWSDIATCTYPGPQCNGGKEEQLCVCLSGSEGVTASVCFTQAAVAGRSGFVDTWGVVAAVSLLSIQPPVSADYTLQVRSAGEVAGEFTIHSNRCFQDKFWLVHHRDVLTRTDWWQISYSKHLVVWIRTRSPQRHLL